MNGTNPDALNQRVDRVTQLLRVCGSLVLVASVSTFLLQRWEGQSDVVKYFFLLAHTVMAVCAGLLCATTIRESRAARTFLLVALAVVPVNYAVTGGFVYSAFALDHAQHALPQFATWVAASSASTLGIVAATVVVTAVTSTIAATPLVRGHVRAYLWRFLAANLCLLLPVRAPELAGVAAFGAAGLAAWFELGHARNSRLHTPEGKLLRALIWLPCALVLGRSAVFYGLSAFLYAPFLAALGIVVFLAARRASRPGLHALLESVGAFLTAAAWLPLALEAKVRWFPLEPFHPQVALGVSVGLLLMSRWARPARGLLRALGCALGLAVCAVSVVFDPGLVSGLVTFVFALSVCCYGMLTSARPLEVVALLVALSGLLSAVARAVGLDSLFNWGSLSALGLLLVFAAALLERRRPWLVARLYRATRLAGADASG